ncbi:MAG: hypothetical protein NWR47_04085 [Aestuariivirgaceae bacterium]|nr:hypothetical protein [Aestuariivirgaceae bacterium]
MSDEFQRQVARYTAPGGSNVLLIYVLYLAGLLLGVTAVVGVVMAYIARDKADGWAASHYDFQIRTFWLMLLYGFIGVVLSFVVIGIPVLMATFVWFIIRNVKGLIRATQDEPIPEPKSWLIGA